MIVSVQWILGPKIDPFLLCFAALINHFQNHEKIRPNSCSPCWIPVPILKSLCFDPPGPPNWGTKVMFLQQLALFWSAFWWSWDPSAANSLENRASLDPPPQLPPNHWNHPKLLVWKPFKIIEQSVNLWQNDSFRTMDFKPGYRPNYSAPQCTDKTPLVYMPPDPSWGQVLSWKVVKTWSMYGKMAFWDLFWMRFWDLFRRGLICFGVLWGLGSSCSSEAKSS